ncbi:MAG: NAD(P)H-binding protein [Nannocystales bacterium]
MSERAFVAGATGYTGRAVVSELRRRGLTTTAHVRPDSSSLSRWTQRFEELGAVVDTTAWELEAMTTTLAAVQPTVVFALLGTTRRRAATEGMDSKAGYERIDYGLSKLLLDACRAAAPQARFIYLSSLGVKEGTRNPYLSARARVERALRDCGQPFTVARPSFISGPGRDEDRLGERVGATVADALLGAVGWLGARRTRDRFASMDADTLAAGLVRAALDPEARDAVLEADALRAG